MPIGYLQTVPAEDICVRREDHAMVYRHIGGKVCSGEQRNSGAAEVKVSDLYLAHAINGV